MRGRLKPKVISIGGSLNLFPHPIREIRAIADEVGAIVLVRRGPSLRHDRRPWLAAAAGGGRSRHDDEHL
jgi:hypothetical protein